MGIKELLLGRCQEKLLSILRVEEDDFFGMPPEAVYIDYGMGSISGEKIIGKDIDAWLKSKGIEFEYHPACNEE